MGKIIEIDNKYGALRGYQAGKGPGVLVLPSWWGLNEFFVSLCDRLASEGFRTLGIDYYYGKVAKTIAEAEGLREKMNRSEMEKQVLEAFDGLVKDTGKAAAIGFSLGARFGYGLLRARPKTLSVLVAFYGVGGGRYEKTPASVLAHYAENDEYGAHPAAAKKMGNRLVEAGISAQSYSYPKTKHWFFEEDRPEYDKPAAKVAWDRSLKFLKAHQ